MDTFGLKTGCLKHSAKLFTVLFINDLSNGNQNANRNPIEKFSKKKTCLLNYTASQKHESTLLHMYVLNEFLTADRSCTTKLF